MHAKRIIAASAAGLMLAAGVPVAGAQQRPAVVPDAEDRYFTTAPGRRYKATGLRSALFGSNWRDVWATPATSPVLHLDSHLGGLKLIERGGNTQTLVLHLKEKDGWREWRYRTVDKYPLMAIPALRGTAAGAFVQDQVSAYFPAAPVMVHPFLEAIGALTYESDLYVIADSPELGVLRDTVPGLPGTFELKPDEAPDDKPGFAGSEKIIGSDKFLEEELLSSREHRVDEREFLAVRLVDLLVNDPDRSRDNFDWARFGDKGAYTWRPIARDRDMAFMHADGLVNALVVRRVFPKQVVFGNTIPVKGLTYITHVVDRHLLQRLTARDFHDVALRVQRAITDSVIAVAVGQLPREWRDGTDADERLTAGLRARRDQLPTAAMQMYANLATEVDVRGTEEADRVDVLRHPDGRVTVTISDPGPTATLIASERRADGTVVTTTGGEVANGDTWYSRTFLPTETNEVRVFAGGGDDVAVVRGAASGGIVVRLIGEKGDDTLADSAGGGRTHLYDEDGSNQLVTTRGTHVDTRPWRAPKQGGGWRLGGDWRPDWGKSSGFKPVMDYNTGAGVIVGAGPRFKRYGFRRLPYKWDAGATFLLGTGNGRLGIDVDADYRFENSGRALRLEAQATQLESTRFFGYGNDTPDIGSEFSRVDQNLIAVEPAMVWHLGWRKREGGGNPLRGEDTVKVAGLRPLIGEFSIGPTFTWLSPEPTAGAPLFTGGIRGASGYAAAGAQVGLELDRTDDDAVPTRGYTLAADVAGYPATSGGGDAFGTARATGAMYVPIVSGGPHLALRAGGSVARGDYPAQFAAAIGGRRSVRGYSWRRYTGDAAAHGSAELRVPVGTVNFLVRSKVGVFALADAGRVWYGGASGGGWHTGIGGGLWAAALGRSFSVAYARGESGRLYLSSGLFY